MRLAHSSTLQKRPAASAAGMLLDALAGGGAGFSSATGPKPELFSSFPDPTQCPGVIVNAADFTYFPMEFAGDDGKMLIGVAYDLAEAARGATRRQVEPGDAALAA